MQREVRISSIRSGSASAVFSTAGRHFDGDEEAHPLPASTPKQPGIHCSRPCPIRLFSPFDGAFATAQPLGLRLDLGARKSDRAVGRGAVAEVASARALRAAEPDCRPPDEQGVRNDRHTGRCRRAGRSRPRRPEAGLGANLRVCSAARAFMRRALAHERQCRTHGGHSAAARRPRIARVRRGASYPRVERQDLPGRGARRGLLF